MENIYNSTRFTNASRVKLALYILYTSEEILLTLPRFTGSKEKNPALRCSRSLIGRLTGNDVRGHYFCYYHYFFYFPIFLPNPKIYLAKVFWWV